MKIFIFLILSITIIAVSAYSQKAILRGKVTDIGTGEELLGAAIVLKDTQVGNITDFDGNYSLEVVPGTYDLQCSFISYETKTITGITFKAGEVRIQDFKLGEAVIGLKEVKVEARQIRRTENALLTMQKKSATVINGISAQEISRAGDSDAAGALKRVTGVSVEGGKYIYVRGLSDRYSKTTLNGAEIPGLDPNRNTVQMDLFPSNIIENMVVHKTFSPELPGSFTGGYVNIMTKDFPEKYTFQFSTSLGFNTQSSFNKDFITDDGGKYDWIGIDDGTRDWPIRHVNEIPYRYEDNNKLDQLTDLFNKEMDTKRKRSFMNHSHSISIGDQVEFLGKPLGYIAALSYQRNYAYYNDGITGRYELAGANENQLNKDRLLDVEYGSMDVLLGGLLNLSYKIANNHKIGITGIRNQGGENSAKYTVGEKPKDEIGMYQQTRELKFLERSITSGQLKGEHYFERLNKLKIDWISSYTVSKQEEPDRRYFINSYYIEDQDTSYEIERAKYNLPARYTRTMGELNFDNKLDLLYPFRFNGAKSKFKFGGAYLYKSRLFEEKRVDISSQNNSFTGSITDYLDDSNIGQNAAGVYGVYLVNATDEKNSYTGTQNVVAGYSMVDIPFTQKLRAIFGARIETTGIHVESFDDGKQPGDISNFDILPSINIAYELIKDMNLRTAYSRTIARPNFRELAPFASYDYETGETRIGNSNLLRTQIDNFDFRWEYYTKPGEIVSVSAFYKQFINPIERAFNPIAANPEITWKNVEQASVYGIELEFRKKLDFIQPLKNLKIGANLTLVKSAASVDSLELVAIHATDPDHPDTRTMFGQSPYIINSFLGYKNDSLGLNANLTYNVAGEKMVVVIVSGTPNIYEQPLHSLNFNISKTIGNRLSFKFSIKNILNSKIERTYEYNDKEYIYYRSSIGRTFSLGFTYLVK